MATAFLLTPLSGFAQNTSDNAPTVPQGSPTPSGPIKPDWMRMPTGDQVGNIAPKAALKKHVHGEAEIRCTVKDDGGVTGCKTLFETPQGYGFGDAAVTGSKYFQMRGAKYGGPSVGGATVTFTIIFHCNKQGAEVRCDRQDRDTGSLTLPPAG
jgi:TonB family protein